MVQFLSNGNAQIILNMVEEGVLVGGNQTTGFWHEYFGATNSGIILTLSLLEICRMAGLFVRGF